MHLLVSEVPNLTRFCFPFIGENKKERWEQQLCKDPPLVMRAIITDKYTLNAVWVAQSTCHSKCQAWSCCTLTMPSKTSATRYINLLTFIGCPRFWVFFSFIHPALKPETARELLTILKSFRVETTTENMKASANCQSRCWRGPWGALGEIPRSRMHKLLWQTRL